MANTEKVRLNKYLSQAGICSRREADVLIEGGKVSVNGKIADPGMRVNDLDKITVEDKPVGHREKKVVKRNAISLFDEPLDMEKCYEIHIYLE